LILCCGLEVERPNQALQSVKGAVNIFDINPKWKRTLPYEKYIKDGKVFAHLRLRS
jgi:hypothetical protein